MAAASNLQDVAAVARVLVLSERQVYALVRNGVLPRAGRGRYDLLACVRAYIIHLREIAAGRTSENGGAYDLVAERARLAAEQADGHAMKNAVTRRELAPIPDFETAIVTIQSTVRAQLQGIGSVLGPVVAAETDPRVCETLINGRIEEACEALADTEFTSTAAAG